MHTIVVKVSHIEIRNYNLGDSNKLEKCFSSYDKIAHRYFPLARYYDEENQIMYLPRGMDIRWLENIFQTDAYFDNEVDDWQQISPIMLRCLPRNEVQREALDFMLCRKKYVANVNSSQLSLNLDTGVGKTYIAITTVAMLQRRAIIITRSVDWLKQWESCIYQYTDTNRDEVYNISGSGCINRLLRGVIKLDKIKFLFITHSTINTYAKNHGWDSITNLFSFLKIGVKIFDEAHLNFINTYMIDFFTNTRLTYYLTATLNRSDRGEDRLFTIAFKNIPKLNLFNEDTDVHAKYLALSYSSRPSYDDVRLSSNNFYGFNNINYIKRLFNRPNPYHMLTIVLYIIYSNTIKLGDFNSKSLIYIGHNDTIQFIYNWICTNIPILANQIGILNSTIPKELRWQQKEKSIILTTIKSSGTASDIKGLKYVVVFADPFTSPITAKQTIGRLRNKNTTYIDILDQGFSALKGYFYNPKRTAVFNKYSIEKKMLYFDDNTLWEQSSKSNKIFFDDYCAILHTFIPPEEIKSVCYRIQK